MSRMAGTDRTPSPHSAVKLTYDDFLLFPDDERHELIDGEHYVTPSPNQRHQRSQHDVVEPDLLYVSRERAAQVRVPEHVRGVPDLVGEVASSGTRKRDETIKRTLYERAGVSEYWVVDPTTEVVRVSRNGASGFGHPMELRPDAGDVLTTPLLPGLEIPLERIFATPSTSV